MEIIFKPIGYAYTNFSDEEVKEKGKDIEYRIEILKEYEEGLDKIDGFSHLIVIFYFHKLREDQLNVLKVKPKRYRKFNNELPLIGVFSCDSPSRPNPIGLSVVEFIKREGRNLYVKGLEAFNGTPILDIKPYTPDRSINKEEIKVPDWYKNLIK
ncbi:MAG: tRNA (N6-threonylcarbamoyladenosine(37)-N6)-methyltransferase TrmO [Candidatus Altarchaeaceae archaeon]